MMEKKIVSRLLLNLIIMMPSVSLLVYVIPYSAPQLDYPMVAVIVAIPFVKFFTPSAYKGAVYPLSTIMFLLLLLLTLLSHFTTALSGTVATSLSLPVSVSTFVSAIIAISVIIVAEGILSEKIYKTSALLIMSLALLLDQLAIVTSMISTGSSYFVAYEFINGEELYSLYTLIAYGYQVVLPLANLKIQIGTFLLGTFIVSLGGILTALYLRGSVNSPETLNRFGYPVFVGALIGALSFFAVREATAYNIQLSVVSASIVVTLVVAGLTSRRTKTILKV